MHKLKQVTTEADEEGFRAFCWPADMLDPATLRRQKPDASWLLTDTRGAVVARSSLWWTATPQHVDKPLGIIGHYAAGDAESGHFLLEHSCAELARRGCNLAVGPMDGNTWQRYRFVTKWSSTPVFFLEPYHPKSWPDHWTAVGFKPLAHYSSALHADLSQPEARLEELERRVAARGITWRPLRLDDFEGELRRIHALSLESFRQNFLYSPISVADFVAQYLPLKQYIDPELVLMAEKEGELVGYFFVLPDHLQAKRRIPIDTIILKTMAVRPDLGGFGFGGWLMAKSHDNGRRLGYKHAIHALMHQDNRSVKLSGHSAQVIREYTLFAKPLEDVP